MTGIKLKAIAIFSVLIFTALNATVVFAHGFGERYDLPIPLSYFVFGASAMVALSFVVIGWFVRQGNTNNDYRQLDIWNKELVRILLKCAKFSLGICSVFLLTLTILTGFLGTENALDNFSPTFVWIIWWVGFGYVVAIFGNLWAIVNPWSVGFKYFENIFKQDLKPIRSWPKNIDAWPALIAFFIFAWFENVYFGSSTPSILSISLIIYSVYSIVGMYIFGRHTWLRNADPFFVFFSLFSRFSMTEIRVKTPTGEKPVCNTCTANCLNISLTDCVDCYECWEYAPDRLRKFSLRPFASGLARGEKVTWALVAFHITALATVTFDGFAETSTWISIQNALWPIFEYLPFSTFSTIKTVGLIFFPILFFGMYVLVCSNIAKLSKNKISKEEAIKTFVFSLVPIALAYNLSHYISFLLITGQQIIPLVSDPFGCSSVDTPSFRNIVCFYDWDLLNTRQYTPNISIINAKFAWVFSVIALVGGHIFSVFIAHLISIRKLSNHKLAVKTQYPMLFLMVFYTGISLWIIAQPIID
ncbi:MAG: hypothetical protein ACJ0BE_02185 [Dehalococcoidia bacterium]